MLFVKVFRLRSRFHRDASAAATTTVPGVFVLSVKSVAVSVKLPLVFSVTTNVVVPPANPASGGSVAVASVAVMPTVSYTELTTFQ